MTRRKYCGIPGCRAPLKSGKNHGMPAKSAAAWKKILLEKCGLVNVPSSFRICPRHFKPHYFCGGDTIQRLLSDVVPTENLSKAKPPKPPSPKIPLKDASRRVPRKPEVILVQFVRGVPTGYRKPQEVPVRSPYPPSSESSSSESVRSSDERAAEPAKEWMLPEIAIDGWTVSVASDDLVPPPVVQSTECPEDVTPSCEERPSANDPLQTHPEESGPISFHSSGESPSRPPPECPPDVRSSRLRRWTRKKPTPPRAVSWSRYQRVLHKLKKCRRILLKKDQRIRDLKQKLKRLEKMCARYDLEKEFLKKLVELQETCKVDR